MNPRAGKLLGSLLGFVAVIVAAGVGAAFFLSSNTIHKLLTENRELSEAVQNLTAEEIIAVVTVLDQTVNPAGEMETRFRFSETDPNRTDRILNEQEFTIRGDIVYFEAMVIKFESAWVRDGRERALHLWRRLFDEKTAPETGQLIERPGTVPERYQGLTRALRREEAELVWDALWSLAHDPDRLERYGIRAVYGNAVQLRLLPHRTYRLRLTSTGQIYPEISLW